MFELSTLLYSVNSKYLVQLLYTVYWDLLKKPPKSNDQSQKNLFSKANNLRNEKVTRETKTSGYIIVYSGLKVQFPKHLVQRHNKAMA